MKYLLIFAKQIEKFCISIEAQNFSKLIGISIKKYILTTLKLYENFK